MQHKFNSLKSTLQRQSINFVFLILALVMVVFLSESLIGALIKILLFALGGFWLFLVDGYVIVFIDDTSITLFYPLRPWRQNTKLRFDEIDTIKKGHRDNFIVKSYNGRETFFSHSFFPSEMDDIIEIVRQKMGTSY